MVRDRPAACPAELADPGLEPVERFPRQLVRGFFGAVYILRAASTCADVRQVGTVSIFAFDAPADRSGSEAGSVRSPSLRPSVASQASITALWKTGYLFAGM